jgi:hypothetical protein
MVLDFMLFSVLRIVMNRYAPAEAWGDRVRQPGLLQAPDHAFNAVIAHHTPY